MCTVVPVATCKKQSNMSVVGVHKASAASFCGSCWPKARLVPAYVGMYLSGRWAVCTGEYTLREILNPELLHLPPYAESLHLRHLHLGWSLSQRRHELTRLHRVRTSNADRSEPSCFLCRSCAIRGYGSFYNIGTPT